MLVKKKEEKSFVNNTSGRQYCFVMLNKRESLADYVSRTMAENKLSFRKVAELSGGTISHSTVAEIANGQRPDVRKDTLTALARGLGVPADDLFRVARGRPPRPSHYDVYAERFDASDLSESVIKGKAENRLAPLFAPCGRTKAAQQCESMPKAMATMIAPIAVAVTTRATGKASL